MAETQSPSIDDFRNSAAEVWKAIADMSREQLLARPIPGKWSTLEVICHVVDSEQILSHRIKRVIAEPRPLLIGYDETRFTASLAYHDREPAEELDLLDALCRQLAKVLRTLPESAWSRDGVHNERGLVTLAELVSGATEHVRHHVREINLKRRALGLPDPG